MTFAIGIAAGLLIGISACEIAGRHLIGYSIVLEVVEWARSLR